MESRLPRGAGTTPSRSASVMACSTGESSVSNRSCALTIAATACWHAASRSRCRPISKTFAYNKGLECLAARELIAITERSLDSAGNLRGFVLAGDKVARFSVKRTQDFEVSDCVLLPPDLLVLERRYSPVHGVAMRIRRMPLASIKEGAVIDGQAMIVADLAHQIDNMEGIAVYRTAGGETILTLVSDDNFSFIQRNLLLQFSIVGE